MGKSLKESIPENGTDLAQSSGRKEKIAQDRYSEGVGILREE